MARSNAPARLRLYVRADGELRQWRGDAEGIAQAWASLPSQGPATLAAQRNSGDSLFLRRGADGRFRFRVIDQSAADAVGHRKSARHDHDEAEARHLLDLFAAGDTAWRAAIPWRRGVFDLPVVILAPATILLCVIGFFIVAGATGGLKGWSWRYLPNLIVGLVMIGAIFAYADWFLRRLRRRIANWLGGYFGLRIAEAQELGFFTRPGMWESVDGGIVSEIKVTVLDILVLIFGLMIPIFAIGTAIVLAARPIMA